MISDKKIVLAGNTLHLYQYNYPLKYGTTQQKKSQPIREYSSDSSEYDIGNQYRSQKALKRIVQANAYQWRNHKAQYFKPIFATLTFKENITSLEIANPIYTNFNKRLNRFLNSNVNIQYVVVPEFQKLTRAVVHYHVIYFNLPYIPRIYDKFTEIWRQGNINIKTIHNLDHLSNYIAKYITKQDRDSRNFNKKSYFTSFGVFRPIEFKNQAIIELLIEQLNFKPKYQKTFHNLSLTTVYKCIQLTTKQLNTLKNFLGFSQSLHLPSLSHYYPPKKLELQLQ